MEDDDQPISVVDDDDLLYCYLQIQPALLNIPGYERRHYLNPRYQLEPPLALCRTRSGPLYFLPMIWEEEEEDDEDQPRLEYIDQVHIEEVPKVVERTDTTMGPEQRYVVEEPLEQESAEGKTDELPGETTAGGSSEPGCESKSSVKLKRRKSI